MFNFTFSKAVYLENFLQSSITENEFRNEKLNVGKFYVREFFFLFIKIISP